MLAPAVVASSILAFTVCAQWRKLVRCPPRIWVSVLCVAIVAEAARDEATVYAGAVECSLVGGSQDFQVALALGIALAFTFALARCPFALGVALSIAFARWLFAVAIVLEAVPPVHSTARLHGERLRA